MEKVQHNKERKRKTVEDARYKSAEEEVAKK